MRIENKLRKYEDGLEVDRYRQEEVLSSLESHQVLAYIRKRRFYWKLSNVVTFNRFWIFLSPHFLPFSISELIFEVPPHLLAVLSVLYGSISLLAVIGNLLVIWIVKTTRQMHTVTNFFIGEFLFDFRFLLEKNYWVDFCKKNWILSGN
jgi:hypothetical protein